MIFILQLQCDPIISKRYFSRGKSKLGFWFPSEEMIYPISLSTPFNVTDAFISYWHLNFTILAFYMMLLMR